MLTIIEFRFSDTEFYVKNGAVTVYTIYDDEIELCSINEFIKAATELQNGLDFSDTDFYVKKGAVMVNTIYGQEIELCSIKEFIKAATELQNVLDFLKRNEGEIRLEE